MSEDEAPQQGDIELAVGEDHLDEAAKNVLAKPNLRALLEDKELQRVGIFIVISPHYQYC